MLSGVTIAAEKLLMQFLQYFYMIFKDSVKKVSGTLGNPKLKH